MNLAFSCSLRMGEMLGLTWDCVDISDKSMAEASASITINKELQRVNKDAMEALDNKDIVRVFPRVMCNNKTALVLKGPKTKTSVRKVFLPNTVALMLVERKKQVDELKELLGEEYQDYNLVFAHPSGRPMEAHAINSALKKLIRENDLPDVVFHSFRHASITYKLKWTGGDMKAVQGDSGHARVEMVADVYSHILDDDRRKNAQRFDEQFYQGKALDGGKSAIPIPDFAPLEPVPKFVVEDEGEEVNEDDAGEDKALLEKLLKNPEMASLLKSLAANL
jgi:integrase